MASKPNEFFIEKHAGGGFAVKRPNAVRASAIEPTQKAAIEKAKSMDSTAALHVARVRNVGPGPDKWRKL